MKLKNTLFLLALMLFSFSTIAQNGAVRGFVYEKETGEPVIFTNVYLKGTTYGSSTDVNGYFTISQIPPGDYTLLITYLGYDTLQEQITMKANDILTKKYFLTSSNVTLETVNVSAERQEALTETRTSVIKVTPKEISQIPTIGGVPDIAQYLQILPGVIITGDQGGQLYIRGGSPIQNKVLLDGMVVYNPFHSIGLFSVFDTDIIRNADIYTGGFNAEHGGRISSVMDITTRDGNKQRLAGKFDASTFGSKLLLEGPFKKQKADGGGSSSFIISAKTSYLDQTSKTFYDYVDEDGLPYSFTDYYGKISLNAENGSKVNFFGFNFTDDVNNFRDVFDFHWESYGGGSNFVVIPGNSPVLIEGHFAYSNYEISLQEAVNPPRTSAINGFNMGLNFNYFMGKNELLYGLELLGFKTDFEYYNSLGLKLNQTENTTELATFAKYKMNLGKWLLEPGVRMQWYASLSDFSLEPRLAMKYIATKRLRFKMAGGYYSQNLISARSDRDIVNLFYGFLSGPENLPDEFDGAEVTHKLQKAQHLILGVEYDLMERLTLNLEGYIKYFSQLTNLNRQKLFDEQDNPNEPDLLTKDFIIERGDAEGVDLTVKYDLLRLKLWTVYSFAYVNRYYENLEGELEQYFPHFDRRHNVNVVATLVLGKNLDWELSGRWNYGSGFPFTRTKGYYPLINFVDGIDTEYWLANGDLGIIYDDINKGRLNDYHRLDMTLKKRFEFGEHTKLETFLSVTNVYDMKNIFYKDRITNEEVYQLPIMPSFGMSLTF